jgi:hypothetical protein
MLLRTEKVRSELTFSLANFDSTLYVIIVNHILLSLSLISNYSRFDEKCKIIPIKVLQAKNPGQGVPYLHFKNRE